MTYFIRAGSMAGFENLVRSLEANPNEVLKSAGLLSCQLRNPDEFINYQHCLNALEIAATTCNLDTFGLRLSFSQGLHTLGLIGAFISRQKTIQEALLVAQKYTYLHADGVMVYLTHISPTTCEFKLDILLENSDKYPQKAQLSLAVFHQIMKTLIGPSWTLKKACFKQSPSASNKQYFHQIFNCDIEFNTDINSLYFDADFLALTPNVQEGLVDEIITQNIEEQVSNKEHHTIDLIEHTIRMLLPTGECSKENTALCINLHPKKLQRLLKEKNTSYRDVLENVRKNEAKRALEADNCSLTDLALNLGYAEFSIFSRRFKAWFGVSPSKWNISN